MFPHPSFFDFEAYFDQFSRLHTTSFYEGQYTIMYPAPVIVCYWFFYIFRPVATSVFLGFILISSLTAAAMVARALIRRGLAPAPAILFVALTYLLSYPFWFEFKQANMEIVVWTALSLGLFAFSKGKEWTAAGLFGIAGALKFYPIIYLALLLSRKRYRECIFGILVAVAVTILSLWALGPTIPAAWHGTEAGLNLFRTEYMLHVRRNEIGFDHSVFSVIKAGLVASRLGGLVPRLSEHGYSLLLSGYLAVVAAAGTALYFWRIRFLPFANQVVCLVVASIFLPPVSYDQTLLHMYAPWAVLSLLAVRAQQRGERIRGLMPSFVLLALAISPLSEFILKDERTGGQLRCFFLLALFVAALRFPFHLSEDGSDPIASVDGAVVAG